MLLLVLKKLCFWDYMVKSKESSVGFLIICFNIFRILLIYIKYVIFSKRLFCVLIVTGIGLGCWEVVNVIFKRYLFRIYLIKMYI